MSINQETNKLFSYYFWWDLIFGHKIYLAYISTTSRPILQTKLHWKATNEGDPHIYKIYKSNNKQPRYQTISNCKTFVGYYLMNSWTDLHNWTYIGKHSSNGF